MKLKAYQILERLEKSKINIMDRGYCEEPNGIAVDASTTKKIPLLQELYDKIKNVDYSDYRIQLKKKDALRDAEILNFEKIMDSPGFSVIRVPVSLTEIDAEILVNLRPKDFNSNSIFNDAGIKYLDKTKDKLFLEKVDKMGDSYFYIVMIPAVKSDNCNLNYLHMKFRGDYEMEMQEFDILEDLFF